MFANSIKSQLFITHMSILEANSIFCLHLMFALTKRDNEIFRQYFKQGKIELSQPI